MSVVINGTGSISGLSNVGGIASAQSGSIIQTVEGTSTTNTTTSSGTFVAMGFSVSITPQFSTSKILVIANTVLDNNGSGNQGIWTIYRNSSVNIVDGSSSGNGFGGVYGGSSRVQIAVAGTFLDSPATTSSTSYAIYFRSAGGSPTVGPTCVSTITLLEIAQ